ncbi:SAM-dependent methyltransferase [Xylella fastidiosa]|uniref:SAM-dependent methyltransferase n=1 Tax=Xylella fastidiosa TaxID=2371 RepID=UPI0021CCA1A1|nr:SAM-dependent methyltransferase [Xylella fastidiosa]
MQHTLACLHDHGRATVVLDTGAVTRGSGSKNEDKERSIRKWFGGSRPDRRRHPAA